MSATPTPTPTFLLLQARVPGDPMAEHERGCFAAALGRPTSSVRCWSLLDGVPDPDALEAADLLLVGGSGDFSVLDDAPFLKAFIDFLGDVILARRLPTFASCFGFQGMVLAAGGEVVHDVENTEVGTYPICLTDEGREDDLLAPLAPRFNAQLGHKDRAHRLPDCFTHLAYSEQAPYQALRLPDSQVFATQFHPELTREDNTMRYVRYQEAYGGWADPETDPVLLRMADSPGSTALLARWVDQVMISAS